MFTEAYASHYDGLYFSISDYEETIDDGSYLSTFSFTMTHLDNGLDVPEDSAKEQRAVFFLQATAKITADGQLDTNSMEILADNSDNGPPVFRVPIEDFFP